ncbi:MAG: hypothetical protein FJY88_10755 [Candidatus Eisenbacteria bacterium]|nr:hypothetical protein [Candidatus Eisenbacteria bacterium]
MKKPCGPPRFPLLRRLSPVALLTVAAFSAAAYLVSCSKEGRDNPLDPEGSRAGEDPFALRASLSGSCIEVTWNTVGVMGIEEYRVYRKEVGAAGSPSKIATVRGSATRYRDCGVQAGRRYEYQVRAADGRGRESSMSFVLPVTIKANPIVTIAGDAATTMYRSVSLAIQAAGGQTMRLSNEPTFTGAAWRTFAGTVSDWELDGGEGTKRVYAQVVYAPGDTSTVVSDSISPAAITGASLVLEDGEARACGDTVSLTVGGTGAHSFRIANNADSLSSQAWSPFSGSYSPSDGWVLELGTGARRVWAELGNDFSSVTVLDSVEVVAGGRPAAPAGVEATPDCDSITVTWTAVSTADSYRIYRDGSANPLASVASALWTDRSPGMTSHTYEVSAVKTSYPFACQESSRSQPTLSVATSRCDMVEVPAGSFTMGSDASEGNSNERPEHMPYISAFSIDTCEATNAEYAVALNWAIASGRAYWNGSDVVRSSSDATIYLEVSSSSCRLDRSGSSFVVQSGYERHPVVEVSWFGATAYCNWLSEMGGLALCYDESWNCDFSASGYRLPTEAEWEKAARGASDERAYPWGDEGSGCSRANYYGCGGTTKPVGSCPSGRSPYGLYDMAGNVWEWCNDWYSSTYYEVSPPTDPRGPSGGSDRVNRGGSWNTSFGNIRCAFRNYSDVPSHTSGKLGFRVARTKFP